MEGYTSIAQFLSKGNKLEVGMELLVEKTMKNKCLATLVEWDTKKDDADKFNFGYYTSSKAVVYIDDHNVIYPFSMILVKLKQE